MKPVKAVALMSGGLDSQLAARMVAAQGVEVKAVTFLTNFGCGTGEGGACGHTPRPEDEEKAPYTIKLCHLGQEYVDMVAKPKFGYGKNANPCMDCRAMMLKNAWEYAKSVGAEFLITGEVLGQRPKSQRRMAFEQVEQYVGLEGKILRPLSAQLLPPTEAEQKGWVDREKLGAVSGRSRKDQMGMAEDLGVEDYPQPAGGCMLTDPGYALRFKDMLKYNPAPRQEDVEIVKYGRIFRVGLPGSKVRAYVGRDQFDNQMIAGLFEEGDLAIELADAKGPLTLLRGAEHAPDGGEAATLKAAELTARYGQVSEVEGARCRVATIGPEGGLPGPDAPAWRIVVCGERPSQEWIDERMVGLKEAKAVRSSE